MAVRNMDAIARKAEQLAEERKERDDARIKHYQVFIDTITAHQQEAIDAVDTKAELERRKIPAEFNHGTKLRFKWLSAGKYVIAASTDNGGIEYDPNINKFHIWRGGSQTTFCSAEQLGANGIREYFEYPGNAFKQQTDELRDLFAELSQNFLAFLHAFFNYVDSL